MAKKGKNKKEGNKNFPKKIELNSFEEKQKRYNELVEQCLEIIKKYKILFITDLVAFLPFTRTTFYDHHLDKSDILKNAINDNKIMMKQALRAKWFDNPAPALQIALYKMICTEEERNAISNNPNKQNNDTKEIGENLANVLRQLTNDKN